MHYHSHSIKHVDFDLRKTLGYLKHALLLCLLLFLASGEEDKNVNIRDQEKSCSHAVSTLQFFRNFPSLFLSREKYTVR